MTRLPVEDGFSMPAEWERHRRCWMVWPCQPETFPDLEAARDDYAGVAQAIARFEPVAMIATPDDTEAARRRCGNGIDLVTIYTEDSWVRDTGPTFLVDERGKLAGVDWPFNGYGELYPDYQEDAALAARMLAHQKLRRFEAPIRLEGGAIHTDGHGTLLTTESVVLNPNRNPGLTREEADEIFRTFLGVSKVIWLEAAMEFDDTGGHIDNLACFVGPGVVAALGEVDPEDSQYAALQENLKRLRAAKDATGRPVEILEIQQPPRQDFDGHRLALSYINHYVANGGVVYPTFGVPADEAARESLQKAYPDREIAAAPTREITRGGGSVHCITQQEPLPK